MNVKTNHECKRVFLNLYFSRIIVYYRKTSNLQSGPRKSLHLDHRRGAEEEQSVHKIQNTLFSKSFENPKIEISKGYKRHQFLLTKEKVIRELQTRRTITKIHCKNKFEKRLKYKSVIRTSAGRTF